MTVDAGYRPEAEDPVVTMTGERPPIYAVPPRIRAAPTLWGAAQPGRRPLDPLRTGSGTTDL
jgi:hypothetical protein